MFKWYDLDEGKLTLNFSGVTSKLNLQIGVYAEFKDNTDYIEHIYPMLSISDGKNYAMALNPSNSLMLASIMSVYTEEGTIKEYFNKTDLSNGWYVPPKYVDKFIFKKVLTNNITLKIKAVTDERKIPLYQFNFIKQTASISIDLTKAEIKSLILFFSNFASNSAIYSFIFKTKYQYKIVDKYVDSVDKSNLLLEAILRRLDNKDTAPSVEYHQDDTLDIHPEIDFTDLKKEVNNVNIVKTVKNNTNTKVKTDVIDIDNLDKKELGESVQKIVEHVEDITGVRVTNKNSFDSVDIKRIFMEEVKDTVIEPVMGISRFDINRINYYKKMYADKDEQFNLLNSLAKTNKIDRRRKNKSIAYSIAKKGILDPKALPTLLLNNSALCAPVTALIYSTALFASVYDYNDHNPNEDFNDIVSVAYKALQMSGVQGQELFGNNIELKEYGKLYIDTLINTILGSNNPLGIGGIRTMDRYFTLNHTYKKDNPEDVYFNFCYFDFSSVNVLEPKQISCLVSALTDIYFLLWYGENKYIKDVKLNNTTGYMMDVVNKPMYELARALVVNLVNRCDSKDILLKSILDFEGMVKYASSWDYETFKEAFIELFSYKQIACQEIPYLEVLPLGSTVKDEVKVGIPCFNYSQILSD